MLNNWDDPFAKFADKKNNTANVTSQSNDIVEQSVNQKVIEDIETAVTSQAAVAEATITSEAHQPQAEMVRTPHAGDGIVSNEQLMATAGAAPQVSPIIEDAPQQTDAELDGDLTGTGLEEIEMGASRIQVDDKKIINCRGRLCQPLDATRDQHDC